VLPAAAALDRRAARYEALAALGPVDGPDVRGMPDGTLTVAAFREQPRELSVIQALRAAFAQVFAQMSDDDRAVQNIPI
jgi:hypothetical protein